MKKKLCTIIQLIKKNTGGEMDKKLETIKLEEMPKYIIENFEKYKTWLDI